jgi:hypothetical protein
MAQTQIAPAEAQPARTIQPPLHFHLGSPQTRADFFPGHAPAVSVPADSVIVCHLADHAQERELEKGLKIRLVAPVYFCASKLEAFAGRGKNDFHASRDLEDLIAVVDGRAELAGEIRGAAGDVRSYLAKEIKKLTSSREFNDALPGHLPPDAASQDRVGTIIARLEEIASL